MLVDERETALRAMEDGELGVHATKTLSAVAKYCRAEGYDRRAIEDTLLGLLTRRNWNNPADRQSYARKIAAASDKYGLVRIDSIQMTENEMDACGRLKGVQIQRLMFTLLFLAKYGNAVNPKNNDWVNRDDGEIFSLANIKTGETRKSLMLNNLYGQGLIRFSDAITNLNINVLCVDHSPNADENAAFTVSDIRNIGAQYMLYAGEPYMRCRACGLVIRRTGSRQMYCKDCASRPKNTRASDTTDLEHTRGDR
ncbi:MAG: hypothetical protein LBD92_07370 [Oscillospiraceae bacterium]|jgi:hypothetical protein|nr:hypothetical protein [Oscillospiraceae bacterium]